MNKKIFGFLLGVGLTVFAPVTAQAEVLVILPASGPMALAANSVREGIYAAYYAGNYKPPLRFVDNSQRSIGDILKKEVKKSTQLIIGPLAREEVEALVQAKPKVKTLALNQIYKSAPGVWQFALSPDEDALAITRQIQADGVKELLVLTQDSRTSSTARFREAMNRIWGDKLIDTQQLPRHLPEQQGALLLGDYNWLNGLKRLPTENIYTVPLVINEDASLPRGLQFCDIPALYQANWPELLNSYQQKPVAVPYQRLLAFGADAWQISSDLLRSANNQNFDGRTGKIKVIGNIIERQPACMTVEADGLKVH
ncbi:penicillin-binding protein activator [Alkanindiges sp. WGS2144]|uniref:penicillin-binding protein activator n=1 Tax=Alkanindiges sp. WGS2144 TaxID=3366808 RepID=UPI0037538877